MALLVVRALIIQKILNNYYKYLRVVNAHCITFCTKEVKIIVHLLFKHQGVYAFGFLSMVPQLFINYKVRL